MLKKNSKAKWEDYLIGAGEKSEPIPTSTTVINLETGKQESFGGIEHLIESTTSSKQKIENKTKEPFDISKILESEPKIVKDNSWLNIVVILFLMFLSATTYLIPIPEKDVYVYKTGNSVEHYTKYETKLLRENNSISYLIKVKNSIIAIATNDWETADLKYKESTLNFLVGSKGESYEVFILNKKSDLLAEANSSGIKIYR